MSKVLVLRMAGPMQSWGSSSRFTRRSTEAFPTKSGILGLLAAAQGRRRTDPIEDLAQLRVAVRVDQRGELLRDFHTAHRGNESMPLSERYYRADAAFVGFVEGPNDLIDGLSQAILRPVFPLYLGRRSCPPTMPLRLAVRDEEMWEVITTTPWLASKYYQKKQRFEQSVSLRVLADEGVIPVQRRCKRFKMSRSASIRSIACIRSGLLRKHESLWKTQSTFQIPRRRTCA